MDKSFFFNAHKIALVGILLVMRIAPSFATNGSDDRKNPKGDVYGVVRDKENNEPLAGLTVQIEGTSFGSTTDSKGRYTLNHITPGKYTLLLRGVGYLSQKKVITVRANEKMEVNFDAQEDVVRMDAVVVTADRHETIRRLAPTLVGIIDTKVFARTNAQNLLQGLTFQPGLRVENNCQNCGFNQVRINGLDGKYTQILIDSRPIFSALAGIYGLEQIPTSMVERIEVVRGGGSALYGSSSIGGVINIITKNPSGNSAMIEESFSLTGMKKPDNNLSFNASVLADGNKAGAIFFGQARNRKGWDADGDGFTELGELDSRSFGARAFYRVADRSQFTGEVHTIQEHRRGGDNLELPDHVVQISERLDHSIYSGNLKFDTESANLKHHVSIFSSAQNVNRKSYYGGVGAWEDLNLPGGEPGVGSPLPKERYGDNFGLTKGLTINSGVQYTYSIDNLLFMPAQLLVGVEHMYDQLSDVTPIRHWEPALNDDGTPAKDENGKPMSAFPGISQKLNIWSQILQLEWKNDALSLLFGGRLDEHTLVKKPIFCPRVTMRYNPHEDINLRFSYAKGFRAPQLFDEELHVGFANGEQKKIFNDPNLAPESSHSFTLSSDMYAHWENVQANLLVEGFFNRIQNIFVDEETDRIVQGFRYYNRINGEGAKVYGVNLEGKIALRSLQFQAGLSLVSHKYDKPIEWGEYVKTVNDVPIANGGLPLVENGAVVNESQTTDEMLRTPNVYGYFTLNYEPVERLNISFSGNLFGKMKVPHSIFFGGGAALSDITAGNDASKFNTYFDNLGVNAEDGSRNIRIDELKESPVMAEFSTKLAYGLSINNTILEFNVGVSNIFNAFQKDYDRGANRDSAYIYGSLAPRTLVCGVKFSF